LFVRMFALGAKLWSYVIFVMRFELFFSKTSTKC
jgi:hypothetical protein